MSDDDANDEAPPVDHSTRASELVSLFRQLAALPSNLVLAKAWARVFGLSADNAKFFACIAGVAENIEQLKAEIEKSTLRPASKETYLNSVQAIELFVQYGSLTSHSVQHVDQQQGHLTRLELLDDVLAPLGQRSVSPDTRKEWLRQLGELVAASQAIEAEPLRAFVVRHLSGVQWAIQNYDAVGIDGISRAYGAMMAEVVRSQGMAGADKPGANSWYRKGKRALLALGVSIAASSAVVQQADNLLSHGEHIFQHLGGGEEGSAQSRDGAGDQRGEVKNGTEG